LPLVLIIRIRLSSSDDYNQKHWSRWSPSVPDGYDTISDPCRGIAAWYRSGGEIVPSVPVRSGTPGTARPAAAVPAHVRDIRNRRAIGYIGFTSCLCRRTTPPPGGNPGREPCFYCDAGYKARILRQGSLHSTVIVMSQCSRGMTAWKQAGFRMNTDSFFSRRQLKRFILLWVERCVNDYGNYSKSRGQTRQNMTG